MEFLRNAYEGFGAGNRFRRYDEAELTEFLDTFAPLFDATSIHASPIGRALTPNHALHDQPVGEVIHALTGYDDVSLLAELERQPTVTPGQSLKHFDPFDLHLALVAVRDGADVLCTSNTTDYTMDAIGPVRIATPLALAEAYGLS
ncbi:MAG TPA: hypothetical protein VI300_13620 [Solirubrobacter sp.]